MRKTPEDFFYLKKNGLLMQAGKIIYLELTYLALL